jgi:hypothetical protein
MPARQKYPCNGIDKSGCKYNKNLKTDYVGNYLYKPVEEECFRCHKQKHAGILKEVDPVLDAYKKKIRYDQLEKKIIIKKINKLHHLIDKSEDVESEVQQEMDVLQKLVDEVPIEVYSPPTPPPPPPPKWHNNQLYICPQCGEQHTPPKRCVQQHTPNHNIMQE